MAGNPMPSDGDTILSTCDRCSEQFSYVSGEDRNAHSGLCKECYDYKRSLNFISPSRRKKILRDAVELVDHLEIYEDRTTFKIYEVDDDGE